MALGGCVQQQPYDYTKLLESKPVSILVIPPLNNSIEVDAPYVYLSTVSKPLAEKGYYVFPVAVVDRFLKENGLQTPADMHDVPIDKLVEHIGPDAILYASIEEWGQKYQVISSSAIVRAKVRLIDARSGELLWDGTSQAVQSSGDGGAGLTGALVSALVTQVINSTMVDPTYRLSKQANTQLFNNKINGLLDGPYKEAKN
ncbi:DUF799 family lipoprotein [bacterium SCSIO 12696]|nr:DUF799 family lipoprotein [bacterium SCSIO 12696]